MKVSQLLSRESVLIHADVPDASNALGILVELQEAGGVITNGTAYYNAVCDRETAGGSTAIGEGIALPHACNAGVAAPGLAALCLRKGVDWGAPDGMPVDLIFMVAMPPHAQSEHLLVLARLVTLLSDRGLTKALRGARLPRAVHRAAGPRRGGVLCRVRGRRKHNKKRHSARTIWQAVPFSVGEICHARTIEAARLPGLRRFWAKPFCNSGTF